MLLDTPANLATSMIVGLLLAMLTPPPFSMLRSGNVTGQLLRCLACTQPAKSGLVSTSARPENPATTARRLELIQQAEREGMGAASTKSIAFSCRDISTIDGRVRDGLLNASIELGIEAYRRQQQAIISRPDARQMLSLAACPTLILVGDSDLVTPSDCAEELHLHIPGSELRLIKNCGHCPPLEHPELVNSLFDLWLARHGAVAVSEASA